MGPGAVLQGDRGLQIFVAGGEQLVAHPAVGLDGDLEGVVAREHALAGAVQGRLGPQGDGALGGGIEGAGNQDVIVLAVEVQTAV